jgi:hypothetical protein
MNLLCAFIGVYKTEVNPNAAGKDRYKITYKSCKNEATRLDAGSSICDECFKFKCILDGTPLTEDNEKV